MLSKQRLLMIFSICILAFALILNITNIGKNNLVLQSNILSKSQTHSLLTSRCEFDPDLSQNDYHNHKKLQWQMPAYLKTWHHQSIGNKPNFLPENIVKKDNNIKDVKVDINILQMLKMQSYHIADDRWSHAVANLDNSTAVFYSVILEQRTAIIAIFPNSQQKLQWINLNEQVFQQEINQFRLGLENYGDVTYNPQQAQKLYNWIIKPFTKELDLLQIKTLVFIPDGVLRTVPMAALHDGEKFLIEKYAIATTPSLNLVNLQTSQRQKLRALAVGLTTGAMIDGRKYQALNNVAAEIRQVKRQIPGSKQLLDENFTRDRLQLELDKTFYPIIHIATHGEFGQFPEGTFLITGDHQKLTIAQLDNILRSYRYQQKSIDLLMVTACETGIDNKRAVMGFAGVALRAGVKTAIAPLWSINDASTVKLVSKFYEAWYHQGVSKAEALRTAQRSLIVSNGAFSHPAYWAAFTLVGSWL